MSEPNQVGPVPESPRGPADQLPADEVETAEIIIPAPRDSTADADAVPGHVVHDHALRRAAEERRRAEQAVWLATIPR